MPTHLVFLDVKLRKYKGDLLDIKDLSLTLTSQMSSSGHLWCHLYLLPISWQQVLCQAKPDELTQSSEETYYIQNDLTQFVLLQMYYSSTDSSWTLQSEIKVLLSADVLYMGKTNLSIFAQKIIHTPALTFLR